jgi:hypothetical protein
LCATGQPRIHLSRTVKSPLRQQGDNGIDARIGPLDLVEVRLHHFERRHLTLANHACEFNCGKKTEVYCVHGYRW